MKTKEFIGTCVENPFDRIEILVDAIETAKKISKKTFLENCFVTEEQEKAFKEYPHDYLFYKNENLYFYEFSGIEYFYT